MKSHKLSKCIGVCAIALGLGVLSPAVAQNEPGNQTIQYEQRDDGMDYGWLGLLGLIGLFGLRRKDDTHHDLPRGKSYTG